MTEITDVVGLLPSAWPASHFIDESEAEAVLQVVRSRSPSRFIGPSILGYADKLEAWYAAYLGRARVLAVNSGSQALMLALSTIGIGPGDEVLVPGYSWASCYNAIVRLGAIPRLVDVDESLTMDPSDLEAKIGAHTRAVLFAHMNGGCGHVREVSSLCRRHGLRLIEDVCQANGGRAGSTPLGGFGDVAVFSFGMNKTLTSGEGGLLACDEAALWERAWLEHDQGYWSRRSVVGATASVRSSWGVGGHMSELTAAMALVQTTKLPRVVDALRVNQRRLRAALEGLPGLSCRPGTGTDDDIGTHLILLWPDDETCSRIVTCTNADGVRTASGFGNHSLANTGLHLYFNNTSLDERIPTHTSGRPWSDPLNNFASSYHYGRGALPRLDALAGRTQLIYISPVWREEEIARIAGAFHRSASSR